MIFLLSGNPKAAPTTDVSALDTGDSMFPGSPTPDALAPRAFAVSPRPMDSKGRLSLAETASVYCLATSSLPPA